MPVLDRSALEASPLADLHAVASELSIDGYRRLRRAELINAVLEKQGGADASSAAPASEVEAKPRRSRSRAAAKPAAEDKDDAAGDSAEPARKDADDDDDGGASRRRRNRRGGRGRGASASNEPRPDRDGANEDDSAGEEPSVEGIVELLAGGSGFVRVSGSDPSDDDVYISSAQVKRCELVTGDKVTGPKRAPRRSERFASLIRIETINGRPASELADSVRYEDLPGAFASEQIKLGSEDATLKAIDTVAPFGKGSRVSIVGPARSGKTETLKRVAAALAGQDGLNVQVVLAGARPEEISEWGQDEAAATPAAITSLAAAEDAVNGSIEPIIDQARRLAARGSDAVVLIDSLDGASRSVARKALGAARNIVDGGSLTVIATGSAPLGGETTVITLDVTRTAAGKFPALDVLASGVLRPELLVGERGAKAIARAHAEAAKPEKK
jgi:transcription termination factor Rho